MTAAAYVLMRELRLKARRTGCARAQVRTLRLRLLKTGRPDRVVGPAHRHSPADGHAARRRLAAHCTLARCCCDLIRSRPYTFTRNAGPTRNWCSQRREWRLAQSPACQLGTAHGLSRICGQEHQRFVYSDECQVGCKSQQVLRPDDFRGERRGIGAFVHRPCRFAVSQL